MTMHQPSRLIMVGLLLLTPVGCAAASRETESSSPAAPPPFVRTPPPPPAAVDPRGATIDGGHAIPPDAKAVQTNTQADAGEAAPGVSTVAATCADRRTPSACFQFADKTSFGACIEQCISTIDDAENKRLEQVQAACELRVIADKASKPLVCGFGRLGPREDEKVVSAAWERALKTRSADIDAVAARILALDTAGREASCTADCNSRGKSRVRAPIEGPGLVRQYKVCMVNADSTMEARKFALYERDLYDGLIAAADKRCREASKCTWVETFSSLTCTYNPL